MSVSIVSRILPKARAVPADLWVGAALGLLSAATVWHILAFANTDISWLVTVGEHLVDGARPYVDIIETNPPGSILLYLPAIWLGRAIGVAPEPVVMVLTALACATSVVLSARILSRTAVVPREEAGPLLVLVTAILALVPAGSFGQREHAILILTLPLLSAVAARLEGASLPVWPGLLAGVGAGIGLAIKPYYGLGLIGPVALLALRRGWREALSDRGLWLGCAVTAALGAAQLWAFPDFTNRILPILARVYLPARLPMGTLLASPSFGLECLCLAGFGLLRRGHARMLADVAALASIGLFAAALLQGKGWPYHAYPAIATGMLALGAVIIGGPIPQIPQMRRAGLRLPLGLVGLGAIGLMSLTWFDDRLDLAKEAPGLAPALTVLGPHPRMMSLSSDIAVGHPLVREIDGRWVGTLMSAWISFYVRRITGDLDRQGPYGPDLAFEDRVLAADIRGKKPDAILASVRGWPAWIAAEPEVGQALAEYRLSGVFGPVMLWVPRSIKPTRA